MSTVIVTIHILVCVALILIVLLQTGRGSEMGAAFGGGASQTLFGSSGSGTFFSKLTTGAAIIFMLTSLVLAYRSGHKTVESVMSDTAAPVTAPKEEAQNAEPTQQTQEEGATVPEPDSTQPSEK